jgi:hypothetical protein
MRSYTPTGQAITPTEPGFRPGQMDRRFAIGLLAAAATFGIASYLHLDGKIPLGFTTITGENFSRASAPEAVIGAVLAAGAIVVAASPRWARAAALSAVGFADLGVPHEGPDIVSPPVLAGRGRCGRPARGNRWPGRVPWRGLFLGRVGRRERSRARGARAPSSACGCGCASRSVNSSAGRCGRGLTATPCPSAGPVLRGHYEGAPGVGVTPRCTGMWNPPEPAPAPRCRGGRRHEAVTGKGLVSLVVVAAR